MHIEPTAKVPPIRRPKVRPIIRRGPVATVFTCPACGHVEVGRRSVSFDATRADGRIRSHIAQCPKLPNNP